MKIAIGADHGGFALKEVLKNFLKKKGHKVMDVGAHRLEPGDDYPEFSALVARQIMEKKAERGILVCGSGVGASVAANKFPGVRAALCHDIFSAHQGVEDDNINVLCLGQRVVGEELAKELAVRFVEAKFSGAERHLRRLDEIEKIESRYIKTEGAGRKQ
ncbi:MAG: ribose 5-phosphate isomerase B [Nitrospiraceae bacterium]|nr:ribose 5-phosphate isomerase B [Nitrospiraceae bacterium]